MVLLRSSGLVCSMPLGSTATRALSPKVGEGQIYRSGSCTAEVQRAGLQSAVGQHDESATRALSPKVGRVGIRVAGRSIDPGTVG